MAIKDFVVKIKVEAKDTASKVFNALSKTASDAFTNLTKFFDTLRSVNVLSVFSSRMSDVIKGVREFTTEIKKGKNFTNFANGIGKVSKASSNLFKAFKNIKFVGALSSGIKKLFNTLGSNEKKFLKFAAIINAASDKSKEAIKSFLALSIVVKKISDSLTEIAKQFKALTTAINATKKSTDSYSKEAKKSSKLLGENVDKINKNAQALKNLADANDRLKKSAKDSSVAWGKFFNVIGKFNQLHSAITRVKSTTAGLTKVFSDVTGLTFAKGGVESAAEFENAILSIKAVAGATTEEMVALEKEANRLGETTKFTATQAAQGFEELVRAGFSVTNAISSMKDVLALAAGQNLKLNDAAILVADTMSQFNRDNVTAAEVTDKFSTAAKLASTTVEKLQKSLRNAGTDAQLAGINLTDTLVAMDLMAKNSLKGAEAGTAFKNMLIRLNEPSSRLNKELNKLGIEADTLEHLIEGLEKAGNRAVPVFTAMGLRGAKAGKLLQKEGVEAFRKLQSAINDSSGATQQAAEVMGSSTVGLSIKLQSALDALARSIGKPILEPLKEGLEVLTNRVSELTASGDFKRLGENIASAFDAGLQAVIKFLGGFDIQVVIGKYNEIVNAVRETFENILQSGTDFKKGFDSVFTALNVTVNGLAIAITAIVTPIRVAFNAITGVLNTALTGIAVVVTAISEIGSAALDALGFDELAKAVDGFTDKSAIALGVLAENAITDFKDIGNAVVDGATSIVENGTAIAESFDKTADSASKAGKSINETGLLLEKQVEPIKLNAEQLARLNDAQTAQSKALADLDRVTKDANATDIERNAALQNVIATSANLATVENEIKKESEALNIAQLKVASALQDQSIATEKVLQARVALDNAIKSGDQEAIAQAEKNLANALAEQAEKITLTQEAQKNLTAVRGIDLDNVNLSEAQNERLNKTMQDVINTQNALAEAYASGADAAGNQEVINKALEDAAIATKNYETAQKEVSAELIKTSEETAKLTQAKLEEESAVRAQQLALANYQQTLKADVPIEERIAAFERLQQTENELGNIKTKISDITNTGIQTSQKELELVAALEVAKKQESEAISAQEKAINDYNEAVKNNDVEGQIKASEDLANATIKVEQANLATIDAQNKLNASTAEISALSEDAAAALSALGVKTSESLKNAADDARIAYEIIKDSGTAAPREISGAFLELAKRSIEANNGVIDDFIKSESAALGLQSTVNEMAKTTFLEFAKASIEANQGFVDSELAAEAAAQGLTDDVKKLATEVQSSLGSLSGFGAGVADSLDESADALENTADSAKDASEAIEEVGDAAESSASKQQSAGIPMADHLKDLQPELIRSLERIGQLDAALQGATASAAEYGSVWADADTARLVGDATSFEEEFIKIAQNIREASRMTEQFNEMQTGVGKRIPTIEEVERRYKNIGDTNLSNLISSIEALNERTEEAKNKVAELETELQDELDSELGNLDSLIEQENKRYENQIAKIKEVAAAAGESGASQLALAEKIHSTKLANIQKEADAEAEKIQESEDALIKAREESNEELKNLEDDLSQLKLDNAEKLQESEDAYAELRQENADKLQESEEALADLKEENAEILKESEAELNELKQENLETISEKEQEILDFKKEGFEEIEEIENESLEKRTESEKNIIEIRKQASADIEELEFKRQRQVEDFELELQRKTRDEKEKLIELEEKWERQKADLRAELAEAQDIEDPTERADRIKELNAEIAEAEKQSVNEIADLKREIEDNAYDRKLERDRATEDFEKSLTEKKEAALAKEEEINNKIAELKTETEDKIRDSVEKRAESTIEKENALTKLREDLLEKENESAEKIDNLKKESTEKELETAEQIENLKEESTEKELEAAEKIDEFKQEAAEKELEAVEKIDEFKERSADKLIEAEKALQSERLAFEDKFFEIQKQHAKELFDIQKTGILTVGELVSKSTQETTKQTKATFDKLVVDTRTLLKDINKVNRLSK